MKNKVYQIIWVDDQWRDQDLLIEECKDYSIEITPFEYVKDAISELDKNHERYEAIILDAECLYDNSDAEPSIKPMRMIRDKILGISAQRDFPYFIYTGENFKMRRKDFEDSFDKYYLKNKEKDKLINNLVQTLQNSLNRKIMKNYSDIFEWYPEERQNKLLELLKYNEDYQNCDSKTFNFNSIRQIIEYIMQKLDDYGLFPHFILSFNGQNLRACSNFLGEKEMENIVPIYIQRAFHTCIDITNSFSHKNKYDINEAPYLIRSTVFELLNILFPVFRI